MIKLINKEQMYLSKEVSWLESRFHFSFAEYYNPENINFGQLRVINDDKIAPKSGFGTHPHRDMEIITYVISGELTHKDSMGNESTLTSGQIQYMSAGTGITHSEYNNHSSEYLTLLQIWIKPNKISLPPRYGDCKITIEERINQLLYISSESSTNSLFNTYQDVNMYATIIDTNNSITFEVDSGRQAYAVNIEGDTLINGLEMRTSDAMISIEENLNISSQDKSHILIIEMKME